MDSSYLSGLTKHQRSLLEAINRPGLAALRRYLNGGEAVAFLGAGVSAPLYPLWNAVIAELIDEAADLMSEQSVLTCRSRATTDPDVVVECIRQELGAPEYREVLRRIFRARCDPGTGQPWTPLQELVVRCNFAGVVTTNYDPGIVNARMAIRKSASGTGFSSWMDEEALNRWRTGDIFEDDELPVLYAHGHHNQPDAIVLATTEFRRAYSSKLGRVLASLIDRSHLVWIGFSFSDRRISSIINEVAEGSGTSIDPGAAPRHVAIIPWDPGDMQDSTLGDDPKILSKITKIGYGCRAVLYPAPSGDHSALVRLLEGYVDSRFHSAAPPSGIEAAPPSSPKGETESAPEETRSVVRWVHGGVPIENFTGRVEELKRLSRWASDAEVRLVGVTAWGGAGKTALITEFIERCEASSRRSFRGVFAWSFYEDSSVESWAQALLTWINSNFDFRSQKGKLPVQVFEALRSIPLLLVLDGLEVTQEGSSGNSFGRLLDGTLRAILVGLCQLEHSGLVLLTSRFPFADLEHFDGAAARMLDVPSLTLEEGADLLYKAGASALSKAHRIDLVGAVNGHALAVNVLAAALRDEPAPAEFAILRRELSSSGRTDARVAKVLQFYASRLTETDRTIVSVVSLFQQPVNTDAIISIGADSSLGSVLAGWTSEDIEHATRQRLTGLLTWHADRKVSAHPLVRDVFRSMILSGETAQLASDITLSNLPTGPVSSIEEARRVVEVIELLLDVGQFAAAHSLYVSRTRNGRIWMRLPAAHLGQRCALSFLRPAVRGDWFSEYELGFYENEAGLFAMHVGDVVSARPRLQAAVGHYHSVQASDAKSVVLRNLSRCLIAHGDVQDARKIAVEALKLANKEGGGDRVRNARACLAAALDVNGETGLADREFSRADRIQYDSDGRHLYAIDGTWWGEFMLRTGRTDVARDIASINLAICASQGWNADVARCLRLLALCDLSAGDAASAESKVEKSAEIFRDGEYVVELAATLPVEAECHLLLGNLSKAEQMCTDLIATLAGPRELILSHAHGLALRSRVRVRRYSLIGDSLQAELARDDAEACLRLATRVRQLPWLELEALEAHANIDKLTNSDGGWWRRAKAQRNFLVPEASRLRAALDL